MSEALPKVVFDCNIFLPHMLTPNGRGGRCVRIAFEATVHLFISDAVLAELRDIPNKTVGIRHRLNSEIVER